MVASFPSSAEGRYAPDVLQRRPAEEVRHLCSLHGPKPNEAQKRKMQWQRGRSCRGAQPATGQARVQAERFEPSETLHDWRQPDGKRRPDPQPSPSPSPQQPRPMTSLQLWLNKPKIDQRVQELERQIGQIALGEAGQGNPELHEFLVTLVTQLFEAEAQAKKADKKEAQATAALLANVQAQCKSFWRRPRKPPSTRSLAQDSTPQGRCATT